MSVGRILKGWFFVVMLLSTAPAVYAQGCSLCTKTAGELDDKSARGLNSGIIYLAVLPLSILGTIGFVWWKHNRGGEEQ